MEGGYGICRRMIKGVNKMGQEENNQFFSYRGKPLVRSGKTIYYGDMHDPYVVMMQVTSVKQEQEMEMADKISLKLMSTDPTKKPNERILKKAEKDSMAGALSLASSWLNQILNPPEATSK